MSDLAAFYRNKVTSQIKVPGETMMKNVLSLLAALLAVLFLAITSTQAQAPDSLSFQGFLTDSSGDTVNATVSIKFTLYDGATAWWTETQAAVEVVGGIFNVFLGSVVPIDSMYFDKPYDLGIKVGTDPEISPRTALAAAPYALGMRGIRSRRLKGGIFDMVNIIGGHTMNRDSAAFGGTVGGGGGRFITTDFPHLVTGFFPTVGGGAKNEAWAYGTVAGGAQNKARGPFSSIGGGAFNQASGELATVAGGRLNVASGDTSFIGGGISNAATANNAAILGGARNKAGSHAAVVGGSQNLALGSSSVVSGGFENAARASLSHASGWRARANHFGSFVWAGNWSTAFMPDTFATTGENQFLIQAGGGVGINTNSPRGSLDVAGSMYVSAPSDTAAFFAGETVDQYFPKNAQLSATDAPGTNAFDKKGNFWIDASNLFSVHVNPDDDANSINQISFRVKSNIASNAATFGYSPGFKWNMSANSTSANSYLDHVFHLLDRSASSSEGLLALVTKKNNPGSEVNFISFYDNFGDDYGMIEGNGTNGVSYVSVGNDFAEMLPRADRSAIIQAGDIVGVKNGEIGHVTFGADRLMVITDRAAVIGALPKDRPRDEFEQAAFVGQVPVRVLGPVSAGDYIIAAGLNDGSGIAVSPEAMTVDQIGLVVGQAWETSLISGEHKVVIEVGLDRSKLMAEMLGRQQDVIEALTRRLDALEAR